MRIGHGLDGLDMRLGRVLESKFAVEQGLEVLPVVAHDLAHEHVFEAEHRPRVFGRTESPQSYIRGSKAS